MILRARHPSHVETDPRRSTSSLQTSPRPFILHTHTLQYSTLQSFLGRSSIRLLHGGTNTESTNGEDQQGPEKNHDADDGGAGGDKYLRRGVDIRFYYILYRGQVLNNGATLPLLIQPARVAKSPDDVDRLEPLPPRLQVECLRGDAALPVLLEGVHSGLPVPQLLGAIGALHHV